ncbi:MAG: type I secretion system permease/ATPase [Alphaproteobacteria bacterium]|nr:type I secretion system permease/ATPase [Alphaproteobacteria bacterium]
MHPKIRSIFLQTLFPVGLFSFFTNLLILVLPIYMLQIFDRVLSTRSTSTLITVTVIALVLVAINAALEFARDRFLMATGQHADRVLASELFDGVAEDFRRKRDPNSVQAFTDLDMIRQFLGGRVVPSMFDAPWSFLFLAVLFLIDERLGFLALGVILLMFAVGIYSEVVTKSPTINENKELKKARILMERSVRNFDALVSMGIVNNLKSRWMERHHEALHVGEEKNDANSRIQAVTHFIRYVGQILILGIAGYLAITDQISPGMLVAANILFIRTIGPFEGIISLWSMVVTFREALYRVNKMVLDADTTALSDFPAPLGRIDLENVSVVPPESKTPTVANVTLSINPGEIVGIHGPSGAGKSSLAKVIVGAWPPFRGTVRYDGFDITTWPAHFRGRYVGFLPQDVELFDGTVAENIARFDNSATIDEIIAAATAAGAHEMILKLPEGYNTPLGVYGMNLSGGQRQRVGLARALFRSPSIVVLDEPDSSLDASGIEALQRALTTNEDYRPTVILISHSTQVLKLAGRVITMKAGRVERDGSMKALIKPVQKSIAANTGGTGS